MRFGLPKPNSGDAERLRQEAAPDSRESPWSSTTWALVAHGHESPVGGRRSLVHRALAIDGIVRPRTPRLSDGFSTTWRVAPRPRMHVWRPTGLSPRSAIRDIVRPRTPDVAIQPQQLGGVAPGPRSPVGVRSRSALGRRREIVRPRTPDHDSASITWRGCSDRTAPVGSQRLSPHPLVIVEKSYGPEHPNVAS